MAADVTHYEIDSSDGVTTLDVRVTRWPGQMHSPDGPPNANDIPADMAEAFFRWLLEREDMADRWRMLS